MFNYKWIKLNDNESLKLEIYGTIREIYLLDKSNKTNIFLGMLDLKLNNDKVLYNDLMLINDKNGLEFFLNKYNWKSEK